ncbi:hypothetical protein [Nocardia sp. AG03]|uniref:hypothetical protein n=1 Tax=Nocardia sp. AG03 TaxID=3025312 RepID=UPI002418712D|nr:hypothetical protein [Nocardia sp. AG03]
MADGLDKDIAEWKTLKQKAIAGEFKMEEGIGEALRAACSTYASKLDKLKIDARYLGFLSGYGGIPSADVLKEKFQNKAVNGEGDNPTDSAVKRLEQHVEIAALMRDTYAAAIGKLQDSDQKSGTQLGQKEGEI